MQYRRVGKEGSTKASHIEGFFRLTCRVTVMTSLDLLQESSMIPTRIA